MGLFLWTGEFLTGRWIFADILYREDFLWGVGLLLGRFLPESGFL